MGDGPVVFLVTHSAQGGVQELWSDLAGGFRSAGHDVKLVALYPPPGGSPRNTAPWLYIVGARPAGVLGPFKLLLALARFFREHRPAMVFSAMPAANVVAPIAAMFSGRRVPVSTSHHSPSSTYHRMLNVVDGWTGSLKRTHAVICVGKTVAQSLDRKSRVYRRKLRIIPNALSPHVEENLAQLYRSRNASDLPSRTVIAVGRLSKEKNYLTLLRCAAFLHDIDIVIVGAGPEETMLKAEADSLGVSTRVRFLGALAREETLNVLRDGAVFVQPSLFEGHSLALIEAAKLGLPLVVSDAASQVEAVSFDGGLRGIVVGLYDHLALAAVLQRLVDDANHRQHWANEAYSLGETSTFAKMLTDYRALVPS